MQISPIRQEAGQSRARARQWHHRFEEAPQAIVGGGRLVLLQFVSW
jgi:hypothetical protein